MTPPKASTPLEERFLGSMLGTGLGDALGAPHEGGILGWMLWQALSSKEPGLLRWTDDTEMAMGLAESLIERRGLDADHLAKLWAQRMEPLRGYGPSARKILSLVRAGEDWRLVRRRVFPEGSYGNGAAMRAAPLGLFYHGRPEELAEATVLASSITHDHPLGIEGALLIARGVSLALGGVPANGEFLRGLLGSCRKSEYTTRLQLALEWLDPVPEPDKIRRGLGNGVLAHESVVTALYAFCRFPADFTAMMDFVIALKGDTDTIGAMAGGLWGARNGSRLLPAQPLERLEARSELERLARDLYACRLGLTQGVPPRPRP